VPRVFASVLVSLRHLVVAAWIAAAVAVAVYMPGLGSGEALELGGLIPDDSPAIQAEKRSNEVFDVPLTADTAVVERAAAGFSRDEQEAIVQRAVDATEQERDGDEIRFALPILNTEEVFPGSEEDGTTAVTHLFFGPDVSLPGKVDLAEGYAERAGQHYAGVTGPGPARLAQFEEIENALPWVELGTVLAIAFVVGLTFRSFGAPLLTLVASGIAFVVAGGLIPWVAEQLDATIPQEVEPLVVALTLGVVTDYTIFFLAACRRELAAGQSRLDAARRSCTAVVPIVATAGLIVVAGTAALVVGELEFFRVFGPALALTAAISLAVSVTFVPSALALLGRLAFSPSLQPRGEEPEGEGPEGENRPVSRVARALTSRPLAATVALLTIAGLLAAATGLRHTELALRLGSGLPPDSEVQEAAAAADKGFAAGVLAPEIVLVEHEVLADRTDELARLEDELGQVPGVAGVIGPREQPPEAPQNVLVSEDGNAARIAVIMDAPPLDSEAIKIHQELDDRLPELLRSAGLPEAEVAIAGQTALASDTVQAIVDSSALVGAVVLALNFVLLALFLRALVAPLFLLAASVLSVAATLGLTTYFFQGLLGHSDLTYYVPFAAGVLLVSLGSDYNVFVAGRIWQEAKRRPLRDAIAVAAPRASRAITVAGIALAASFAMLAIVPIDGFREFAFMMGVGVLLETFVVRPVLIPALMALFGETGAWPGRLRHGVA
jgi:putative drug exporter of the RND superfamily